MRNEMNNNMNNNLNDDIKNDKQGVPSTSLLKRQMWALALLTGLMLAGYSEAASIYSCAGNGERCVVRLEGGTIGDQVRILDEKARPIAGGRIIKRKGNFAVISVIDASQTVRKGYPVIVNKDSRSSSLQWAAAFPTQH